MSIPVSKTVAFVLLVSYVCILFHLLSKQDVIVGVYKEKFLASNIELGNRQHHIMSHPKSVRVYVYNWNQSITNRWPKSYNHHRLSILPHYQESFGAGRVVNASIGLHATHQYTLFTLFLSALQHSTYVTDDPSEADFFFIPYDLGMDSSTRQSDGALTATNCPVLPSVLTLLQSSPYFQRYSGRNHILVHSINQPMTFFANAACRKLYETCYHCLKLSIDTYTNSTYEFLNNLPAMTHNWVSVPFPSNFHDSKDVIAAPWRQIVTNADYFPTQYLQQRSKRICFVGSMDVTAKKQQRLRRLLIDECLRLGLPHCWLSLLSSHSSNQYTAEAESSAITDTNPYAQCRLCLSPGGDFPTRKAVLDTLLSGCIPVIFEVEAAWSQWAWHWGNVSVAQSAVVYVDRARLIGKKTHPSSSGPNGDHNNNKMEVQKVFEELLALSEDVSTLEMRLQAIAAVGDRMQYNNVNTTSKVATKDAFAVIMEHLLEFKNNEHELDK